VASAGSDNTVRLRDVKSDRERLQLAGPKDAKGIRAAAYFPDSDRIVSVTFEETIQLWDAASGTQLATAVGTDKGLRSMALSADGKTVATCGQDKVIKLWDLSLPAKS
jgi:WD40 repeat protein